MEMEIMMSNNYINFNKGLLEKFGNNVYIINTQKDFEKLFGNSYGSYRFDGISSNPLASRNGGNACKIPANTTIILNPIKGTTGNSLTAGGNEIGDDGSNVFNGRPAYVMKNGIELSKNVHIIGFNQDDTIIIKDDSDNTNEDNIRFLSPGVGQEDTWSETITHAGSSTTFTSSDGTNYSPGDLLHWNQDNSFYRVVNVSGNTITVNKNISAGTSKVITQCLTGIKLEGWTYDCRGGVDGFGGTIDNEGLPATVGGAFDIWYVGDSILNCKIINSKQYNTGSKDYWGSAINGKGRCAYIEALNIYHCYSNSSDGGKGALYGLHYSNLRVFSSYSRYGGATSNCNHSNIKAIGCSANYGGGCSECDFSTAECIDCYATSGGGGLYNCNYIIIVGHWGMTYAGASPYWIITSASNNWKGMISYEAIGAGGVDQLSFTTSSL
jgi:hypothetical protein